VGTVRWTADQMLRRMLPMGATDEFRDASGRVAMAQVDVHPAWLGRPVEHLEAATGARVAFLTRFGDGMITEPTTVLQEHDVIHLLLLVEEMPRIERILTRTPPEVE